jgi:hypothetical protein
LDTTAPGRSIATGLFFDRDLRVSVKDRPAVALVDTMAPSTPLGVFFVFLPGSLMELAKQQKFS